MNICIFIGNMTADPEMRFSTNGKPVTNFSIAINERRGENEETEFLDFICWEKLAETVAEYARKGRKVAVQASYHTDHWIDKETGGKRSKVRFRARQVQFLDKPPEQQQSTGRPAQPTISDDELDSLPF